MWQIAKTSNMPLHESLTSVYKLPYTISYVIRKRMQLDSFLELPKEKRPPEDIQDDSKKLEEWFDRINDPQHKQTEFTFAVSPDDIEG